MSKEEFKAFSEEISLDDDLQKIVKQINNSSELIKVGREKGFNFTVKDISEGLADMEKLEERDNEFFKNTRAISGLKAKKISLGLSGLPHFSEDIRDLAKD
jgi:predicted ribosomally synthesized peptide with nif11-like leader